MDINMLIGKSQMTTKRLDMLQDEEFINEKEKIINDTLHDLKYIIVELEKEKFKIIGDREEERKKTEFNDIQKIHAIKEYCRRYEGGEISTQAAECYINSFIFYVDVLPQDIPDFDSVYDVGSCYLRPLYKIGG